MEHSSIVAKRLWQVVHAVFYMLRVRGISKKKLMLDFHLFLDRGKLAGKSFIYHLTHHRHHHRSKYNSSEVEFSCSNTPSYPSFNLPKRKTNKYYNHDQNNYFHNFDVKEIAKALEALNGSESPYVESPIWSIGKSPAPMTHQLRITDSPFPVIEEEDGDMNKEIDMEAEEFIRRFYEQLRSQQSVPATPVCKLRV
jgi:Cotton fibre expressed protein